MSEPPPLSFALADATVRDVLEVIQRGSVSAAFAVDVDGRLAGIVTDGDIRRALLDGAGLDDPVRPFVVASPLVIGVRDSRAVALDIMRGRLVSQLPVVDDEGRLVGVHTLHALVGGRRRERILAVILAGGRGTRLHPATEATPKPMMSVAGRPILERLVMHLAGFGVTDVVLAVGYLADSVIAYFGDGERLGVRIRYVVDPEGAPLGTCGPLTGVRELPDIADVEAVVVLNGDLLTNIDVAALVDDHQRHGARLTVATRTMPFRLPYAVVADTDGVVTAIDEKPVSEHEVNLGVYVLDPSCLERIPAGVRYDMTELVDDLLVAGEPVRAWRSVDDWLDVGTPSDLGVARGTD